MFGINKNKKIKLIEQSISYSPILLPIPPIPIGTAVILEDGREGIISPIINTWIEEDNVAKMFCSVLLGNQVETWHIGGVRKK